MKVLIVSDTHGQDPVFRKVLLKEGPVDQVLHAGDIQGSHSFYHDVLGFTPFVCVAGNCDLFSDDPDARLVPLKDSEYRVYLTHGHHYHVSATLSLLTDDAARHGAQIAVFGHTHRPEITTENGILCINPGSLAYPRQENHRPSYVVMEVEKDRFPQAEIRYL